MFGVILLGSLRAVTRTISTVEHPMSSLGLALNTNRTTAIRWKWAAVAKLKLLVLNPAMDIDANETRGYSAG